MERKKDKDVKRKTWKKQPAIRKTESRLEYLKDEKQQKMLTFSFRHFLSSEVSLQICISLSQLEKKESKKMSFVLYLPTACAHPQHISTSISFLIPELSFLQPQQGQHPLTHPLPARLPHFPRSILSFAEKQKNENKTKTKTHPYVAGFINFWFLKKSNLQKKSRNYLTAYRETCILLASASSRIFVTKKKNLLKIFMSYYRSLNDRIETLIGTFLFFFRFGLQNLGISPDYFSSMGRLNKKTLVTNIQKFSSSKCVVNVGSGYLWTIESTCHYKNS